MIDLLRPFFGYVPVSKFGSRVVGPPRTTLTSEQKALAAEDPLSFRFAAGRKAGTSRDEAHGWLEEGADRGVLRPIGPAVIVYQQTKSDFTATGVLGDLSLAAYEEGRVKRHEKTIANTRRKMAEYMRTTRVYGNPAVTAAPADAAWMDTTTQITTREPDSEFTTVDGIRHRLWIVEGKAAADLCDQIDSDLYITDGHHRLASALLVASEEGKDDARIPVGVFPANEFRLRAFARCITDPDLDEDHAVEQLEKGLETEEVAAEEALPRSRYEFGSRVGNRYLRVRIPDDRIPEDHYASLNTNLLQELILGPVFGIHHPRLDQRLRFAADLGGSNEPCAGSDARFLPFPLEVADVMKVADSGQTMPAKSTWFEPKLPSGLVIRPVD